MCTCGFVLTKNYIFEKLSYTKKQTALHSLKKTLICPWGRRGLFSRGEFAGGGFGGRRIAAAFWPAPRSPAPSHVTSCTATCSCLAAASGT